MIYLSCLYFNSTVQSAGLLHVSGVSHPSVPGLGGALVRPRLEPHHPVPALSDLLLREVPLVLDGHLGPEGGAGVLRVLLGHSGQGVEAETDLERKSWIAY